MPAKFGEFVSDGPIPGQFIYKTSEKDIPYNATPHQWASMNNGIVTYHDIIPAEATTMAAAAALPPLPPLPLLPPPPGHVVNKGGAIAAPTASKVITVFNAGKPV